jgi:hypothetical protein
MSCVPVSTVVSFQSAARDGSGPRRARRAVEPLLVAMAKIGAGFRLHAWVQHDAVRVEIEDPTPRWRLSAVDEEALGIRIVEHVVSRWGVIPSLPGKIVWFEVDVAAGDHRICRSPGRPST